MELSYGKEYERFRAEVREFLDGHKDTAPSARRAWERVDRARSKLRGRSF